MEVRVTSLISRISRAASRMRGRAVGFVTAVMVATGSPGAANVVGAEAATAASVTVFENATLIDGRGGKPRGHVAVFVKRGLIEKIEDAGAARPSGATVIDMTGRFLMPELINAHGHVGLLRGTETSADNYTEANVQRQLLQYQDYGVGAVLVMGTDHDEAYTWRAETQSGARPGARLYTAGRGFGVPDGLPPAAAGMNFVYRPSTPDEARKNVQELARHHPDLIKMWVDDSLGRFPKMSPAVYAAIIDEAHKQHLRAAAHLFYEADAQRLVDLGIDVFAHSVRDADIPDPLLAEMKRKHVVYIGTLSLDDFAVAYDGDPPWLDQPFFRDALEPGSYEMLTSAAFKRKVHDDKVTAAERAALPIALRNLKKVHDAGILVALGTDSGATPVRFFGFAEHIELQLLVQAGLTPLEAITAATRNGALLLNIADRYGTLTPGRHADFIVLTKDPTTDIRNSESIESVWRDGIKVSDGPHAPANAGQ